MTGTLVASTINAGASASLLLQSNNTTALTLDTSQNVTAAGTVAMASSFKRNRIINGNMLIDQRNAGASVTFNSGVFATDRWCSIATQTGKFTAQQNAGSVTPPTGFSNYLGLTVASAYSVAAGDTFGLRQSIEGFNVADLNWGSASAKSVTLSFQVYSSLTGTQSGALINSAAAYSYPFTFNVASANTWTSVSITIAGPTSGTWLTTNGTGIEVRFNLGSGSTYLATAGAWGANNAVGATGSISIVGTSGATFYITGVQLEVGTKATPYETQIYSDQLAQCLRYYYKNSDTQYMPYVALGTGVSGVGISFFPVPLRATGTFTVVAGGNGSSFSVVNSAIQCMTWVATGNGAGNTYINGYTASAEL